MAKNKSKVEEVEVDFDDYEEKEGSGYDGEQPKKGTYDGKLVSLRHHTSAEGNDGFEWIYEITEEPYVGWRGWTYSNLEAAKWRTQQMVKAITGAEDKVKIAPVEKGGDGSQSPTVKNAGPVRLRIRRETYEDEPRARIAQIMPPVNAEPKKKKKKKDDDEPF